MPGQDVFNAIQMVYSPQGASTNVSARADNFGNLGTNSVFPRFFELVRNGFVYCATSLAAATDAGIAGVTTLPTTTGGVALYNAATAASGIVVVPLMVGISAKSGTVGAGITALVGVAGGALATPLTANGTGRTCISQVDNVTSDATTFTSQGLTIVQPKYTYFAGSNGSNVGVGAGFNVPVEGLFSLKPTQVLDVSVLSPTGSSPVFYVSIFYMKIKADVVGPQ